MFYSGVKKLIAIEAKLDCQCYEREYCSCSPYVEQRSIDTVQALIQELRDADNYALAEALIDDPAFQRAMKQKGWTNFHKLKGQQEKVKFQERFFLVQGLKNATNYVRVVEVDLNELSTYEAARLADKDDAFLAQKVTTTSLKKLNPKAYKAYLAESKKKKAASERAKKAAATRKKKKLEKELSKAKKLLEKHSGE
jgi:hypothetical protein